MTKNNKKEEFRYLPKFADLIDRLSIDIMKKIFIHSHKKMYGEEIDDIMHDIDLLIKKGDLKFNAKTIHSLLVIMLTNREIWLNESKAREGKKEHDILLKFTHSVNGIRNTAKNIISKEIGDRIDLKIDTLAEEFVAENFIEKHGDWRIFEDDNT